MEPRLKIEIELNLPGDGRSFLNFWDYMGGEDVTAEIKDNKLIHQGNEITLNDFINKVKDVVRKY